MRNLRHGLTLVLIPRSGGEARSVELSPTHVRRLTRGAAVLLLVLLTMAVSWLYFALRAREASHLEERLAVLEAEAAQVEGLVADLAEVEARYRRIEELLGAAPDDGEPLVTLPAPAAPGATGDEDGTRPTTWPLAAAGFVSQPLLDDPPSDHPGLDIAVPHGTYIRAAGPGTVVEADEDPVYGRYVALEHPDGYRTLYAHASEVLVESGQTVRRGEVLGLTGSTGRSTAPHLHFEVERHGERIDPLALLRTP